MIASTWSVERPWDCPWCNDGDGVAGLDLEGLSSREDCLDHLAVGVHQTRCRSPGFVSPLDVARVKVGAELVKQAAEIP